MHHCKGTFWRYKKNKFINKKGELIWSERVSYLKRESCEGSCQPHHYGCESDWLKNELSEYLANSDLLPSIPDDVYNGCILELKWSMTDPEYGFDDLWFEVVKKEGVL